MVIIPIKYADNRNILVVIIEEQNFERMKNHDPITIHADEKDGLLPRAEYESIMICYASAADMVHLTGLVRNKQIQEILKYLTSGYVFDPAQGDGVKVEVLGESRNPAHRHRKRE